MAPRNSSSRTPKPTGTPASGSLPGANNANLPSPDVVGGNPTTAARPALASTSVGAAPSQADAVASAVLNRTDTIPVPMPQDPWPLQGLEPRRNDGSQAVQTTTVNSSADLMLQYIASSGPRLAPQFGPALGFIQAAGIHALPLYIDELERDWGTDIYLKMMWDACVKSSCNTLIEGILANELQITSALSADTEKDPRRLKLADSVAAFLNANMDDLGGGFKRVSREILEGIYMGYKVAEQVYEIKTIIPQNGPQTVNTEIAPLPQEAVSMVVDQYNHRIGYLPRLLGVGLMGSFFFGDIGVPTLSNSGDEQEVEIPGLVPEDKCICFTWMPRNNDPRGTSHIRAAYIPWRLKIGLYPAYEAYLARFAQPSAALELNGADLFPLMDSAGRIVKDPRNIILQLLQNLKNFQAGGAMVIPNGTVKLLQAGSNGQAYLSAFELADEQITISILYSNLSTQGGKYGTQALGEVHQDTANLPVLLGMEAYADCIREQWAKPLVRYNYGDEGLAVLPKVGYTKAQIQDTAQMWGAAAQLKTGGLMFPQQYNEVFKKINMPPLPDDVINKLIEAWETQLASQNAQAQNPGGFGQSPQDGSGSPQGGNGQKDTGQGANGAPGGSQKQPGQGSGGQQGGAGGPNGGNQPPTAKPAPQQDPNSKYW